MVEGPEATYMAEYVLQHYKRKSLTAIKIVAGRYKHHGPPQNYRAFIKDLPLKLLDVYKKGKIVYLLFEGGWTIIVRFGMEGWFYKTANQHFRYKTDKPNIIFYFGGGDELKFMDFRNFGTLTITNNMEEVLSTIGMTAPDILDNTVHFKDIQERLDGLSEKQRSQSIDIILMDQTAIISGIGNIIKSEILYEAGISPHRKVKDVTPQEWKKIFAASHKITRKILGILRKTPFSIQRYIGIRKVYDREEDPMGRKVVMYKSADGRATFWVPSVQK